jgi:hypothetical protein
VRQPEHRRREHPADGDAGGGRLGSAQLLLQLAP